VAGQAEVADPAAAPPAYGQRAVPRRGPGETSSWTSLLTSTLGMGPGPRTAANASDVSLKIVSEVGVLRAPGRAPGGSRRSTRTSDTAVMMLDVAVTYPGRCA
jgi:hypothetical protein